jgi:hypothetical protein
MAQSFRNSLGPRQRRADARFGRVLGTARPRRVSRSERGSPLNEWTFVRCAELHNYDQVQTSVIVVSGGFPPSPLWGWRHVGTRGLAKVR